MYTTGVNSLSPSSSSVVCTVNNVQIKGDQCTQAANQLFHNGFPFSASTFFGFFFFIMALNLIGFVVWLIAIIHVVKHPDIPDRTPWIIGLVLAGPIAAIAYIFIVKRPYDKAAASYLPSSAGWQPQTPPVNPPYQPVPTNPSPPPAPMTPPQPTATNPFQPVPPAASPVSPQVYGPMPPTTVAPVEPPTPGSIPTPPPGQTTSL